MPAPSVSRSIPLVAALVLALAAPVRAEIKPLPTGGWAITQSVTLPGTPERAYDAATGDLSPWWDHTFHDKPLRFILEPWAGGGFYEIWNDEGEGVKHATVTWAERGKRIRFEGPLGLAGNGVVLVTTWDFDAKGDSTVLACTANLTGAIPEGSERAVNSVWNHFLVEGLKPYMLAGRDRDKKRLTPPSRP
jgi:hypothetical protein